MLAVDALRTSPGSVRSFAHCPGMTEQMTLLTADRALQKYKVDLIFCGK